MKRKTKIILVAVLILTNVAVFFISRALLLNKIAPNKDNLSELCYDFSDITGDNHYYIHRWNNEDFIGVDGTGDFDYVSLKEYIAPKDKGFIIFEKYLNSKTIKDVIESYNEFNDSNFKFKTTLNIKKENLNDRFELARYDYDRKNDKFIIILKTKKELGSSWFVITQSRGYGFDKTDSDKDIIDGYYISFIRSLEIDTSKSDERYGNEDSNNHSVLGKWEYYGVVENSEKGYSEEDYSIGDALVGKDFLELYGVEQMPENVINVTKEGVKELYENMPGTKLEFVKMESSRKLHQRQKVLQLVGEKKLKKPFYIDTYFTNVDGYLFVKEENSNKDYSGGDVEVFRRKK